LARNLITLLKRASTAQGALLMDAFHLQVGHARYGEILLDYISKVTNKQYHPPYTLTPKPT
jgi:hypothetical protein